MRLESLRIAMHLIASLKRCREGAMLDLLFLAIGLGFFAVGFLYLYCCDRL